MDISDTQPVAAVRPARVLIVQPDRAYLGVLARRISDSGYRIATATSAQAALAEMNRIPVDIVLAELRLGQTGGAELVAMIRDDACLREIPVLLFTGRADTEASVRAFAAGADGIILKPFHFEVLAARIARELVRAQALAKLRDDNAALDARVVTRAIELGEMRERWQESERERRRLQGLVTPCA